MSIFGKIWSKVTASANAAVGRSAPAPAPAATSGTPHVPTAGSGGMASVPSPRPPAAPPAAVAPAAPATPAAPVDVEAIMMDLEAKSGHKSNWRYSIVDLMSLLGMENSLAERRELARELGYTGDMGDTAKMNIWLHKQVMRKMAENGGRVPADMLD
jgi:hypothetical protein